MVININWIDNILIGLKENFGTNDIYELYNSLNIKISKLESSNILLNGNEAFYYRDYLESEVVFIRNDLNLKYEKFILAHELAHALLHTHIYEAAFNKSLINSGKLELQANYFAFQLLSFKIDPLECHGLTKEQISAKLGLPANVLIIADKFF